MVKARLYYEAHVTVGAKELADWPAFALAVRTKGWRASCFDEDDVDDMSGKWFLSFRHDDLAMTRLEIESVVLWLKRQQYDVLRWKIEDTLFDSKHGDTFDG